MTRYKKYMKEKYELQYEEDYECLPYEMSGHILIEGTDVFAHPLGLYDVVYMNVMTVRSFYTPDGRRLDVEDEDFNMLEYYPELKKQQFDIRIYNDFPHLYCFVEDDRVIAVQYRERLV